MTTNEINGTLDAIKLLDKTRMTLYSDSNDANAVTGIVYRAARKLDKELKAALTGDNATTESR